MVRILGISAFYHDSAAALIADGRIVAAAQEERFTRRKHDSGFPVNAVRYCLAEADIQPAQLDYVAFYDKPLLKFERMLETWLRFAPIGFRAFVAGLPLWLRQKLHLPREMDRGLLEAASGLGAQDPANYAGRYVFVNHHESHAASAFFASPFDEAAILTVDGVGEWSTATYGRGRANRVELTHELRFPHSLGLLYSAMTYFTGFKVNSGEYKLMGLAPYGKPVYKDAMLEHLIDLKPDGSFRMDQSYFNYCTGLTMTHRKMDRLLDGPPRRPETPLTQREMDIAASVQEVAEEILLRMARHVRAETGLRNLVLAGGVALNCVANGKILREEIFDDLWIQPAAGDAGGALGAALFVWHQLLDEPRTPPGPGGDRQCGSLLGPAFGDAEIRSFLDGAAATYRHFDDETALLEAMADELAAGKVVGHFDGRMEFGPRALGNRSILGDPRRPEMQSIMNRKIKFRESFRPFAPSVLREKAGDYFEIRDRPETSQDGAGGHAADSPYMLLVGPVRPDQRIADEGAQADAGREEELHGIDRLLKTRRSRIPAVTHVDYTARVQTVDPARHRRYYRLLKTFEEKTGCPLLINTSFNVRGEPIVCSPEDAYRCFMATNMDVLVLGNCLLRKEDQPEAAACAIDEHLARFELD